MSVPQDLASMELLVWICHRATSVSAQRVSPVSSVRMKYQTVLKELAPTEQCARTYLDQTTSSAFAEMDLKERTVMLPKTHAQRMATPVTMELCAEHFHREGIPASVPKDGVEHTVKRTLMTVWNNPVFLVATVLILFMTSNVTVHEGSQGKDVRKRWTCVLLNHVPEECALISFSDMNVFVSLAGLELTVM